MNPTTRAGRLALEAALQEQTRAEQGASAQAAIQNREANGRVGTGDLLALSNMQKLQKIEICFPCTVDVPEEIIRRMDALVSEVCELYETQNPTRIMWPAGHGCKINWSRTDAAFLGRPAEPDAKESGEPDYDDSIYEISVSEREAYEGEREKRQARRQRGANTASEPR